MYNGLLLVLLCTFISACTSFPSKNCNIGQEESAQESIYFGTGKKEGYVTSHEWSEFLDNTVTPKFPEGLTVTQASGQWKGNDGVVIKEPSYILTIVHNNSKTKVDSIIEIINTYKTKFQQEAVLRVKSNACISF